LRWRNRTVLAVSDRLSNGIHEPAIAQLDLTPRRVREGGVVGRDQNRQPFPVNRSNKAMIVSPEALSRLPVGSSAGSRCSGLNLQGAGGGVVIPRRPTHGETVSRAVAAAVIYFCSSSNVSLQAPIRNFGETPQFWRNAGWRRGGEFCADRQRRMLKKLHISSAKPVTRTGV
jgi:hypothetical protein